MAYGFNEDKTKASIEEITDSVAADKVDKVSGKVLSENNYTTTDKNIVSGIPTALSNKVDKVTGKGLSDNDFTTAYKTKAEESSYSNFGTSVLLSSAGTNYYSASNPYTCPHDGYVKLNIPDAFYGGSPDATLYMLFGSSWISHKLVFSKAGNKAVFVKKGMKIYGTSLYTDSSSVRYYPMTS